MKPSSVEDLIKKLVSNSKSSTCSVFTYQPKLLPSCSITEE
ncbi:AgrD family cyclic lactone autoinducer peptide [Endozoicomonas sp.]